MVGGEVRSGGDLVAFHVWKWRGDVASDTAFRV